jgi:hypothetical protein
MKAENGTLLAAEKAEVTGHRPIAIPGDRLQGGGLCRRGRFFSGGTGSGQPLAGMYMVSRPN